jgi:RNA polymerase sigma factor (sigma-70 family)
MNDQEWLAERFQEQRPQLRGVAYRILGSLSESDDALQEAWLRVSRSDASGVENLGGWLTTVVSRVALNMLRARKAKREAPLEGRLPDPVVSLDDAVDPEREALIADSVGLALLVVLETLSPAERLAFVLHDMFGVPFDEIAPIVDRSPEAARQLASRARRRVRGETTVPDADLGTQREVVDAFLSAAREGNLEALLEVLDPDVIQRTDAGAHPAASGVDHGAATVARQAITFSHPDFEARPALINGAAGIVTLRNGKLFAISGFTIRNRRIVEIDILADPERLGRLDLPMLD